MSENVPSIIFRLDVRSDRAPYRQLVDQVVRAIERGQLRPGDRLPSVRDVVGQITINPNTVHRAYREMEHLGLAEGRPGLGTFVSERRGHDATEYQSQSWRDVLRQGIEAARLDGVSTEELAESFHSMINDRIDVRP